MSSKDFQNSYHVSKRHNSQFYETGEDLNVGPTTTTIIDGIPVVRTERKRELSRTIKERKTITEPEEKVVEKIVKVPHKIYQTKVVEKQSGKTIDEIVYVPRIVHQKKFVEGPPEIQYKEIPRYVVREVNHVHEQVNYKEIEVPQYVDVPVNQIRYVPTDVPLTHRLPEFYESVKQYEIVVPKIVPVYKDIEVPLYVPRLVESHRVDETEEVLKKLQRLGLTQQDLTHGGWDVASCKQLMLRVLNEGNVKGIEEQFSQTSESRSTRVPEDLHSMSASFPLADDVSKDEELFKECS